MVRVHGPDFVDALAGRARVRVEVNVLLDGWGSAKRNAELATDLERAGSGHVALAQPITRERR